MFVVPFVHWFGDDHMTVKFASDMINTFSSEGYQSVFFPVYYIVYSSLVAVAPSVAGQFNLISFMQLVHDHMGDLPVPLRM